MSINFFEHQKTIAKNLVTFIRVKGYSKLSLSKLTGISRPTIDQILKGESPSQTTYNGQITKINQTFDLPDDYFITAQSTSSLSLPLSYAYSDHSYGEEKSEQTNELLEGLDNVLDIYSMYV
ncbi:helix-turn-helix domain-containing protein [Paenibacillus sp. GCM10027626]|uniref:helix-turn-helix domain-containing protein n=1 Tax=Paenibacillus sp. GCM10027626 TaxID=3273411 RepID=UPI00362B11D0